MFSSKQKPFIHVIDQYIDNERSKVVNDLEFTGCVQAMELVPRPWAPQDAYNSTGDRLRTDGACCSSNRRLLASENITQRQCGPAVEIRADYAGHYADTAQRCLARQCWLPRRGIYELGLQYGAGINSASIRELPFSATSEKRGPRTPNSSEAPTRHLTSFLKTTRPGTSSLRVRPRASGNSASLWASLSRSRNLFLSLNPISCVTLAGSSFRSLDSGSFFRRPAFGTF